MYKFTLFLLFIQSHILLAQFSIGISIAGIGYHPQKDNNTQFYKWKLHQKGQWIAFASISVIGTWHADRFIGVKAVQTFVFHDCAGKYAGVSHIGLNLQDDIIGWQNIRHNMSASFGPLWYYRRNWIQEPDYVHDSNFMTLSQNERWERKFVWHGGQIEYSYAPNGKEGIALNILPGYPYLYTFSVGVHSDYNR